MLHAIKKTRIHEEVVTQIHDLIREGRLKAGDQLPSERELSETFKVSRTSVREALRALETKGLIISRTGMGNFVADLPIESLIAPLAKLLIEEKTALADIFELRKLIEPHIAALAAERDKERHRANEKHSWKTEQAVSRGETGVDADAELHFAIGQATQNQALGKACLRLDGNIKPQPRGVPPNTDRREASIEPTEKFSPPLNSTIGKTKEAMFHHIERVEECPFIEETTGRL